MGKSAFTASIVDDFRSRHQVLATFFCKFGNKKRSDPDFIIKSLSYQIALNLPKTRELIQEALNTMDDDLDEAPLDSLFEELVMKPLNSYDGQKEPMIMVIDALDEIGFDEYLRR